jgi:hypothetical protein
MARKRTSAGGPRLRIAAGGGRTRNLDCCCEEEECTETTAQGIAEYIRDNHAPSVAVTSDDYRDECVSGNCSALTGTYTIPHLSIAGTTNHVLQTFQDTFTLTLCGTSRTVTATLELEIDTTTPGTIFLTAVFKLISGAFSQCRWAENFQFDSCDEVVALSAGALNSGDTAGIFGLCNTDLPSLGDAELTIS